MRFVKQYRYIFLTIELANIFLTDIETFIIHITLFSIDD